MPTDTDRHPMRHAIRHTPRQNAGTPAPSFTASAITCAALAVVFVGTTGAEGRTPHTTDADPIATDLPLGEGPLPFPPDPTRGHNPAKKLETTRTRIPATSHGSPAPEILFVDRAAPAGGDGATWASAFTELQHALAAAEAGVVREIRVAEGTYTPDLGTGDRDAQFLVLGAEDLALLGGFPAGGGPLADRDPAAHPTRLSGDLEGDDAVSLDQQGRPVYANTADNSRRVLDVSGSAATVRIDGFTVAGGHSPTHAGGLLSVNSLAAFRAVRFEDCSAHTRGGGALVESFVLLSPTFESCEFTRCTAERGGGVAGEVSELRFTECSFTSNAAVTGGGAQVRVREDRAFATVLFADSRFESNIADGFGGEGGAIFADADVELEADRCEFVDNSSSVFGGAISASGRGAIRDSRFIGNAAAAGGGAIYAADEIARCRFEANRTEDAGGAVSAANSVRNCEFIGNAAAQFGGAGYSIDLVFNCDLIANTAGSGEGGGLYAIDLAEYCRFEGNTAAEGGAVGNSETLRDCTIVANTAETHGGGAYRTRNFERCVFEGNTAGGNGGGIYQFETNGPISVADCVFRGNTAGSEGGGQWGGRGSVLRSTFIGNHAAAEGGGLAAGRNSDSDSNAIRSCLFAGNSAGLRGGAIADTEFEIANCTIVSNHAPAAGGLFAPHALRVRNSIIWGNDAPGIPLEQQQVGGTFHAVTDSIIEGIADYFGAGNTGADPRFLDPVGPDGMPGTGDEDFTPLGDSPAIDSGDETAPAGVLLGESDLRGSPRLIAFTGLSARIDRGAIEARDCDRDLLEDRYAATEGLAPDCNGDLIPDACQIAGPTFGRQTRLFADEELTYQFFAPLLSTDGHAVAVSSGDRSRPYRDQTLRIVADRGDGWQTEAIFEPPQPYEDVIGHRSDFDGDRIAFAAWLEDTNPDERHGIYIAEREGGAWTITDRVERRFEAGYEEMPHGAIDLAGDLLVTGWEFLGTGDRGEIDVWEHTQAGWDHLGHFGRDDWATGDYFGNCVAIVDGAILASAPGRIRDGEPIRGAIGVYEREGDAWTRTQTIEPPGPLEGNFGWHFAIHGDTMAVGEPSAPRASGNGLVHLYRNTAGVWQHTLTIAPREGDDASEFGETVGIDDRRIVAVANNGDRIYLFDRDEPTRSEVIEQAGFEGRYFAYADGTLATLAEIGSGSDTRSALRIFEDTLTDADGDGTPDRCDAPCSRADTAAPYGVLDLADIAGFIQAFADRSAAADLAQPLGVFDLADITQFVQLFGGGCP